MFINVTDLFYWKSERKKKEECEDACAYEINDGVFAIADGVGTASFSNIWARILTTQFKQHPLISSDPFEVEYWLRKTQDIFRRSKDIPSIEDLTKNNPLVVEKARQGSLSTLAGLRIAMVTDDYVIASPIATIEGDSCIFHKRKQESSFTSFPISDAEHFDRNPICLPSNLGKFNRIFHKMKIGDDFAIGDGDTVLMATDAISRWIIGRGKGKYENQGVCFDRITNCKPEDWAKFVDDLRSNDEIVDDDCVALVLRFSKERLEYYEAIKAWRGFDQIWIDQREKDLEEAQAKKDKVAIAVCWGDGKWMNPNMRRPDESIIQNARAVSGALNDLRHALLYALDHDRNRKNIPVKEIIAPVWKKWEAVGLEQEDNASNLIKSLKESGFIPPINKNNIESSSKGSVVTGKPNNPSFIWQFTPEVRELIERLFRQIEDKRDYEVEETIKQLSDKRDHLNRVRSDESINLCDGFRIALSRMITANDAANDKCIYLISQLNLYVDHKDYFQDKLSSDEFTHVEFVKEYYPIFTQIVDSLKKDDVDCVYDLTDNIVVKFQKYLNIRLDEPSRRKISDIQFFTPEIRKLKSLLEKDNGTGKDDDEIVQIENDFRCNYKDYYDIMLHDLEVVGKLDIVHRRASRYKSYIDACVSNNDVEIIEAYDELLLSRHWKVTEQLRDRYKAAQKHIQIRDELKNAKENNNFFEMLSVQAKYPNMKWTSDEDKVLSWAKEINSMYVELKKETSCNNKKMVINILKKHLKEGIEINFVIEWLSPDEKKFVVECQNELEHNKKAGLFSLFSKK